MLNSIMNTAAATIPLDGISDVTAKWGTMLQETFNGVAGILGITAGIALVVAVIFAVVTKNDAEKEGQIRTLIWILGAIVVGVMAYSLITWAMGGTGVTWGGGA